MSPSHLLAVVALCCASRPSSLAFSTCPVRSDASCRNRRKAARSATCARSRTSRSRYVCTARLERLLHPRLVAAQADARPMDALGAAQAEAMHVMGTSPPDTGRAKKRAAYLQGFSLHAAVHLHANDREGLAHLCGYGARPPFSQERLSELPDGRLAYRLKRPLGDGRQTLLLQATELLRRLATLVPPPRAHLVRYHGVFAPASSWRSQVIPPPPDSTPSASPSRASACMESEDPAPAATEVPPPQALAEYG